MTELRLTFPSEGFPAVSQVLVDMGLSFHVEPVGTAARQEAATAAETPPTPKRTPAKKARKTAKAKRAARSESPAAAPTPVDATVAGAERLRAAIARSGPDVYRSPLEPPADTVAPPAPDSARAEQSGERSDE